MSIPFFSKVASRQIHITTEPAPRNLVESRLVLKALQKFGEVVYFYNLKYERQLKFRNSGRALFAIFESEESANAAVAASPFRIPLSDNPSSLSSPSSPSIHSSTTTNNFQNNKSNKPRTSESDQPDEQNRTALECTINHSDYDHADALRQNPYYNTFSLTTNTLEFQDLTRKDGSGGIPLREFADCFTGRKKPDPFRFQERVLEENRAMGVDSLMGLWKMGQDKERMERLRAGDGQGDVGEGKSEREMGI